MFFRFFSWNDYFIADYTRPNLKNEAITVQKPALSGNAYVLDCFFGPLTSSSAGGAIKTTNSAILMIESTTFFECKTVSGIGGAFFYSNKANGQCVVLKTCSYGSICSQYGQFYSSEVVSKGLNIIEESSVIKSITTQFRNEIDLNFGNIKMLRVNSSDNELYSRPAFLCYNSDKCDVLHSTFAFNNATTNDIIYFNGNRIYTMNYCNIVKNTASNNIFLVYGNLTISNSCFIDNKAVNGILTIWNKGTIIVTECSLDFKVAENPSISVDNAEQQSFIIAMKHLNTQNCPEKFNKYPIQLATKRKCMIHNEKSKISLMNHQNNLHIII